MNKFDLALKKIKDLEDFVSTILTPSREKTIIIHLLDEAHKWMIELETHHVV